MNNYHIYDEIGKGKYSVVYKGRKKRSIEYLAIKSVEKSRRKKILNEVRIMHNLDHENILKFYSWYETRNHLWIIFEYCAGGSLLSLIESDKTLPEESVRTFAFDLMKALLYLHSSGIIYGDLKPSNILFNEYGQLKLADFGLSRKIVDLTQGDSQSKRGTPFYMAPELFQDDGVYSFYSDFWSLGCVIYELATGQPPYVSTSFQELVENILNAPVPDIPEYSREFNDFLKELMQKDPAKRISWDEVTVHPIWKENTMTLNITLPSQPLYEKYLKARGVAQRTMSAQGTNTQFSSGRVDLMRMSQNIQKNLLRESVKNGYQQKEVEGNDVKLDNRDQVVDFGEYKEEEEDEESEENSEQTEGEKDSGLEEEIGIIEEEKQEIKDNRPITIQGGLRNPPISIEEERPNSASQRVNSAQPTTLTKQSSISKPPPPFEAIMIHNSDTSVKPIIGNRELEKQGELTFNPQTLGFQAWTSEDVMANAEKREIEAHFHQIYQALTSSSQGIDKLNILTYFETLIINSTVANKLIVSPSVGLLIRLLRSSKSSPMKVRICSILGQMVRYSTFIEVTLAESGLYQALSEQIKDKNEKVRRRAMAALGEYLFYAATQMDDEQGQSVWEIPHLIFALVIKVSKSGEDEILRFYAIKTIENITAQSTKAGTKFAIAEVAQNLCSVYLATKNEYCKVAALSALCHVIRLNLSLCSTVIERLAIRHINSGLSEDLPKIQQNFLTILVLITQNPPSRFAAILAEDKNFLSIVLSLLENPNVVIRGKALILLNLLIKANVRWILILSENKFFSIIEKLLRDSYRYVQWCLFYLLVQIADLSLVIVKNVAEDMKIVLDKRGQSKNAIVLLPVVQQVITSGAGANHLSYPALIKFLVEILDLCLRSPSFIEITQQIMLLLEALSGQTKQLAQYSDVVIKSLLPSLLTYSGVEDIDIRFRSLKIFSDILIPFLYEDSIYDPGNSSKVTTKIMNELLVKQLMPLYQRLLSDHDPIPLYAHKLLSAIIERCAAFVSIVKRQELIPLILESFEGGNPKLNVQIVSIVKRIVESKETTLEELAGLRIIQKVNSIMRCVLDQDWCIDKMLDILYELLFLAADSLRAKKSNPDYSALRIIEPLTDNFPICAKLVKQNSDQNLIEKCTHCLSLMIQLFCNKIAQNPTLEMIQSLIIVLSIKKPSLQRRCLKVLKVISQSGIPIPASPELASILRRNEEKEIQQLAADIWGA